MKKLISYFIKYPVLGNAIFVTIFLFGAFAFLNLKTTFFPDVPSNTIIISASYPGASPEEIEEGIILKIEDNLKGITGIDRITSVSKENSGTVTVELFYDYDVMDLLQEINSTVNSISSFPVGMEKINVYKQEMRDFVIAFAVNGELPLKDLKTYARRIERELRASEGISKVSLSGFPDEEIEVSVRENDLRAYGLTFSEVSQSVASANIKITGGTIRGSEEELLIRTNNKGYYAKDLENHVVKATSDGTIIRLKDVADVKDKWSEDPNRVYFNGEPAVMIDVQKTNDEDLFQISGTVRDYIADFNSSHDDVQIHVLRDGAEIIEERIDILSNNGLLGMILVVVFLGLSLNPRLSFWVALAIPLSFAGMFMLGTAYGLTANVMSLMSMILVIGILVDDGIVIAENIYQHYERGEKPFNAAVNGTMEVLPSVVSAVFTTIVIFLTFFFLEGGLGDRTKDVGFVVIATLFISLVEAVFILPAHIAHSKALTGNSKEKSWLMKKSEYVLHLIRDKFYLPVLKFCVSNPVITVASVVAIFIITIGAIKGSIIKMTFFPTIEGRSVTVTLEMPAGTRDYIVDDILAGIEEDVWKVNENYKEENGTDLVTAISREIGPSTHTGDLRITLIDSKLRELSSQQINNILRDNIRPVEGAEKFQVGGGTHFGMPVSIALQSDNLEQLHEAKNELKAELRKVDKLKDVNDNDPEGRREVKLEMKQKAYALGLTTTNVLSQVRGGFYGNEAQRILRGIDEVRIWIRYEEDERKTIEQLENMYIRTSDGKAYPLKEIAELSVERGIMSINHIDAQRVVKIEADVTNSDDSVPDILADISQEIMPAFIEKYPDVNFFFEGQSRENTKTTNAMSQVIPPILILMFMIVVFTFRSFMQAVVVFLLIPFSMIGVAWGHFFQGYILSMLSTFGAIALIGIVINDSLVFVNAMNRYLKQGQDFMTAVTNAGINRFRPVLLTSVTTIAGLAPLMFETSHQAQFLSPMAISVAYGLLFGTILTLLLLPSLLVLFNKLKVRIYWLIKGTRPTPESVEPANREEEFLKY